MLFTLINLHKIKNITYICYANNTQKEIIMTTLMFNNMPGREQVQVLYNSSLLGCSQHCWATYFNFSKSYANTREKEIKHPTRG